MTNPTPVLGAVSDAAAGGGTASGDAPAGQPTRLSPPDDAPTTRRLGAVLAAGGSIALVVAAVLGRGATGAIVSASFFAVIVGLVLLFPTLLQDGTKTESGAPSVSSMRVATLMVVSTFALATLKAGWGASKLSELQLDPTWAWVLAAALGGKAFQSFAEANGKGPTK
jgi:hypothetical protein